MRRSISPEIPNGKPTDRVHGEYHQRSRSYENQKEGNSNFIERSEIDQDFV